MKIKWSKGFTLVELMVVVFVVGVVFALIAGAYHSDEKVRAEKKATAYSEEAAEVAHTNGHAYHNIDYWKEVVTNASDDYQPVCVHGIPAFIARRGSQTGDLILLNDQRGHKQASRFWAACKKMGKEMVEQHKEDQ